MACKQTYFFLIRESREHILQFEVTILSQVAGGTKVHVYLTISRGNLDLGLYCTFRPNKYTSVCRARSDFLWAPANKFFLKSFYKNYCQKTQNFRFIDRKNQLYHQKDTIMDTLIFEVFVELSCECLKTYFQTSAQEICAISGLFAILKQQ